MECAEALIMMFVEGSMFLFFSSSTPEVIVGAYAMMKAKMGQEKRLGLMVCIQFLSLWSLLTVFFGRMKAALT